MHMQYITDIYVITFIYKYKDITFTHKVFVCVKIMCKYLCVLYSNVDGLKYI